MMAVDGFLIAAKRSTQSEFVERFPGHFLLVEPFATPAKQGFTTVPGSSKCLNEAGLVRLEKRPGANTFSWMITLGRANNNDIVVPAGDVSKFHAMIRPGDDAWSLVDAHSRFGTTLEGVKLTGQEPVRLLPGFRITMGSVVMWFHTSETLYDALKAQDL